MRPDYSVKALLSQAAAVSAGVPPRQQPAFAYGNQSARHRDSLSVVVAVRQTPALSEHQCDRER